MDSLDMYAAYLQEREDAKLIRNEFGFAVYKVEPTCVYLQDIWVRPEHRKAGRGVELMNDVAQIAKDLGFQHLVGSAAPETAFGNEMIKIMYKLGFNMFRSEHNLVYMVKEI